MKSAITIWEALQKKSKDPTYVINGTIKWRKQSLRATTFAIAKLDNYIGINSDRQFNSAPHFFLYFGGTNIIFADSTSLIYLFY